MIEMIRKIENMVRDNPELERLAKEGLSITIKHLQEANDNSKKWKQKNK